MRKTMATQTLKNELEALNPWKSRSFQEMVTKKDDECLQRERRTLHDFLRKNDMAKEIGHTIEGVHPMEFVWAMYPEIFQTHFKKVQETYLHAFDTTQDILFVKSAQVCILCSV